jgi:hypothetical protein
MTAPMPLEAAVRECFPHGGVTVNTLRRAIRTGELSAELIGKRLMVTADDIEAWREKCRVQAKGRACTFERGRVRNLSMLSEMERKRSAQDALQRMLTGQRKPCGNTSQAISGRKLANVT